MLCLWLELGEKTSFPNGTFAAGERLMLAMRIFFGLVLAVGAGAVFAQAESGANVSVQRDLPYAETDNPRQKLDLFLPKQTAGQGKLPVIVFVHGGGWKSGDKGGGARVVGSYVESGKYAGVSVGYRLTNEAQWPAQIHDCKAAIRWVRGNADKYGLDASKIAVWGTSAGGHLVSMLGTSGNAPELEGDEGGFDKESSAVTCVVNFFGPQDFETMVTQPSTINRTVAGYPEALLLGGRVQDRPEAARGASPVTYIDSRDAAFLTAHGTKDPLVPFAQATELHEKLKAAGVRSLLLTMDGSGHGFASAELDATVMKFLAMHLRGEKAELTDATIIPQAQKQNGQKGKR